MIIDFLPDGRMRFLYQEDALLDAICSEEKQVERATDIVYNEHLNRWEVRDVREHHGVLFSAKKRSKCIQWEAEHEYIFL